MKFNYLDLIAQSSEKYRKTLSYLVLILMFCSVIFYIVITNNHGLQNYNQVLGYVDEIKKDEIKVKSKALFNFKSHVFSEVISIKINNGYHYVDREYKSEWDNIVNEVSNGVYIKAHYKISEGYKFLVDIQKKESTVLSINHTKNKQSNVIIISFSVLIFFLSVLLIIIFKRIAWLRNKNN